MAVPVIEAKTVASTNANVLTQTINVSSLNIQEGDGVILVLCTNSTVTHGVVNANGRKQGPGDSDFCIVQTARGTGTGGSYVGAFSKIAGASEPTTYTVDWTGSARPILFAFRVSGVSQDWVVTSTDMFRAYSSGSSYLYDQCTTYYADCLAVTCWAAQGGNRAPFSTSSAGWSIEDEEEVGTSGTGGTSGGYATRAVSTAGGTTNCTIETLVSGRSVGFQFAINPTGAANLLPKVRSWTQADSGGATSTTIAAVRPDDMGAGYTNVVIVGCDSSSGSDVWQAKPGWTKQNESGNATSAAHTAVYTREWDGSEGATETFTQSAANECYAFWLAVDGANNADLIDVIGTDFNGGTASFHEVPGPTVTETNTLVLCPWAFDGGDGVPIWSHRGLVDDDEMPWGSAYSGTGSSDVCGGFIVRPFVGSGAYGTTTIVPRVSDGLTAFHIAIKPKDTSTVGDDLDIRWNMTGAVHRDLDLRWNMAGLVNDDLDTRWNILNTVPPVDLDTRWNISALVTDDLDARWNIQAFIADDLQIQWDMQALIAQNLDVRWNVRALVNKDLDLQWDIFEFLADDLQLVWDMAGLVNKDLDLRWNIISLTLVSKDLDLRWNLNAMVSRDLNARWNVRALVGDDLDARWDMVANVPADLEVIWNIDELVGQNLDTRWMVKNLAGDNLDAQWHIVGKTGDNLDVRWDIEALNVDRILPGLDPVHFRAPQFERETSNFTTLSSLGQSSRPTFRAYAVVDQAISANTETQLTFAAKSWDFGRIDTETGQQDGSFNIDADTMEIQLTGIYGLHFNTTMEATTEHRVEFRIYVNGQLFVTDHRQTVANQPQTASFARERYLERGDVVELRCYSVGNPVTIKDDRDWTGRLVNR